MDAINKALLSKEVIHRDPEIMSGAWVFVGTRVPLQTFFDYLEEDFGLEEFVADFPHLKQKAILTIETIARTVLKEDQTDYARSA